MDIIVGLHNITSSQRLIDFARVIFNFDIKYFVITKVSGTAAQVGIPEISKLAFKNNKSIVILPDLKDAIDLLKPSKTILISHNQGQDFAFSDIINKDSNETYYFVFSGIESGFSKLEQALGTTVKLSSIKSDIGPTALASIFLYCYLQQKGEKI
ncbi:exonuclease [Acidianus sulfidivorans JP7]|uniref:Exonuclease n=1 Tax=Acidianus sulfidivorans JP7 TaxID=619593 RepID=A0A2U9IMU3_9CREN|nr:RecB-family nuclease [Acidianus sulfidivorans]AWR97254.1 exonuclease [Acidianus sulfidivorans JP7]